LLTIERTDGTVPSRREARVEKQNVTLSLPREMVRQVKVIAAQRDTSISGLMVEKLKEIVDEEHGYEEARERSLDRLREGFDLGTAGRTSWTRDESHER
jgi:predicted transcriptional regulator